MARIHNIHDDEIGRRIRGEQHDPLSMCIVVRKNSTFDIAEIAHQVIKAVRTADNEFPDSAEFGERYQLWIAGSFRKICLKAKAGQFEQLAGRADVVHVGDVIICPPQYQSSRWEMLSKLQVLQNVQGDFVHIPPHVGDFLINDSLDMSHGKILAQIGHAALLSHDVQARHIGYVDYAAWESLAAAYDVICTKDGGITEIAAGSETIMAVVGLVS